MGCTLCRKDLTGSSEPEPIWSGRGYPSGGGRGQPPLYAPFTGENTAIPGQRAQMRTDVCTALSKGSDAKPEERTEPVGTLHDAPGAACCVEYTAEAKYGLKLFRPDSAAERFYLLGRAAGHLVTAKSVYMASYRPDSIQQTDLMTGEPRSVWLSPLLGRVLFFDLR